MLLAMMRPEGGGDLPTVDLGGAVAHVIDVPEAKFGAKHGFYVHGGGLTMGAGQAGAWMGKKQAEAIGLPMHSVDYRMPPAAPYPAGLDDCLAAYRALIETRRPSDIVMIGASAGLNFR